MTYTITVFTKAGAHSSAPMPRASMENLVKELKGARFSASVFPESVISFQSGDGAITFLLPGEIVGWAVKSVSTHPRVTGYSVDDYSVLGDA